MSNISEMEILEQTILDTIKTKKLSRFTLIENNLSFKNKSILINERYINVWESVFVNKSSFSAESLSVAKQFLDFIDSIPDSEHDFYLSCILLLSDFLNASKIY